VGYSRIGFEEREEVSRLLCVGFGVREIARALSRSPGSISREVRRPKKGKRFYRVIGAQRKADKQASSRKLGKRRLLLNKRLAKIVSSKPRLFWSPSQIAAYLRTKDDTPMQV